MHVLKVLGKGLLYLVCGYVIYGALLPFLWGPIYDFPEPKPFEGEHFFNPYSDIDSNTWFKGNFHAHGNPFGFLTDGRKNTSQALFNRYDSLNYKSFAITNYTNIDTFKSKLSRYIPAYEHGYSPIKYHQLVLGANKVHYFDYPIFQFTSNKQYILNLLNQSSEVLAIAHPEFVSAYSKKDAQSLCHFQMVEVMNQRKYSFDFWDAALSAGHAVWILGNDDTHDLSHPADYGMQATLINAPSNSKNDVLSAMKKGKTIGYAPVNDSEIGHDLKVRHRDAFPRLLSFKVSETGEIVGRFNKPIKAYHVLTENGKEVLYKNTEHQDNKIIRAQFKASQPYLRFKVNFEDADLVFLNPVVRYDGKSLPVRKATVNLTKTIIFRGSAWLLFFSLLFYFYRRRKRVG
jgi:hypothetical protein